jgi:hypothetical protein
MEASAQVLEAKSWKPVRKSGNKVFVAARAWNNRRCAAFTLIASGEVIDELSSL